MELSAQSNLPLAPLPPRRLLSYIFAMQGLFHWVFLLAFLHYTGYGLMGGHHGVIWRLDACTGVLWEVQQVGTHVFDTSVVMHYSTLHHSVTLHVISNGTVGIVWSYYDIKHTVFLSYIYIYILSNNQHGYQLQYPSMFLSLCGNPFPFTVAGIVHWCSIFVKD